MPGYTARPDSGRMTASTPAPRPPSQDASAPALFHVRRGQGKPLLLIHGLGSSWQTWTPILPGLEAQREVITVDLPGFGHTPPLPGEVSIATLADAVTEFLTRENLLGIDAVGTSMGARLVLELARRGGVLGAVVSLDPGGFWQGWERAFFYSTVAASIKLIRALQPVMPALTASPVTRSALFAQFSSHPWALSPELTLTEMRSFAASPSTDELLRNLAYGEAQQGLPRGRLARPLVIGWGRWDRVCLPVQASRAQELFPDARLHWFDHSGHFPHWDMPAQTLRVILDTTA